MFSLCPPPGKGRGNYIGWGEGVPTLDGGGGIYPGCGGGTWTERVLTMPRAVRLLRSRRRTILLSTLSPHNQNFSRKVGSF